MPTPKSTKKIASKSKSDKNIITVKNAIGDPNTTARIVVKSSIKYAPKVSVIIPVYNCEPYLAQCLDSLINQTLQEIEIICVDDGSTDESIKLLKEYAKKDTRITVITQKNSGSGIARNCGIGVAAGEFIAFMDGDDFYPADTTLEHLYSTAQKKRVSICGGTVKRLKDGEFSVAPEYLFDNYGIIQYSDYQFDYGYWRFIYNRKLLKDNNILFPDYLRQQDPVFFVKAMMAAGKFYAMEEPTYIYRVSHTQKQIEWTTRKCQDVAKSMRDLLVLSAKTNMQKLHMTIADRTCSNYFINVFKNLVDSNDRPDQDLVKLLESLNYDIIYANKPDFALPWFYKSNPALCKISVIIPVYNVEKYLARCLDSLINQTYKNLEIICVNDGSTDGSLKILKKYAQKDNRIKVISQRNAGLSAARNTGLKHVSSEYVYFMDSDDYISTDALETLWHDLTQHNSDMAIGSVACFGDVDPVQLQGTQDWFDRHSKNTGKFDMPLDMRIHICATAWNKLYKMSIIKQHNIQFPDGLINEDEYWLWAYGVHCKNYSVSAKKTYFYLQRSTSIMGQRFNGKHALDLIDIHIRLVSMLRDNMLFDKYQDVITTWFKIHTETIIKKLPIQFYKDLLKKIEKYVANYNDSPEMLLYINSVRHRLDVRIIHETRIKKQPFISVIIPVYNAEKYLKECLDSLVHQTLKNIEIICVDDGSQDGSMRILKEYAKKYDYISIIKQANQRQGVARNNGMKIAHGEYIGFIDPDDWVSLDYYELLYKQAQQLDSEIVIANHIRYNENTHTVSSVPFWRRSLSNCEHTSFEMCAGKNIERDLILQTLLVSPCYAVIRIYKADFIKHNEIFFADISSQEDCIFILKAMLLAKNISYCPFATYFYRIHQKSTVRVLTDMYKNNIKAFLDMKGVCDSLHVDLKKNLDYFITKNLSWSYSNIQNESKGEFWNVVNKLNIARNNKETLKRLLSHNKKTKKYYLFGILPLYSIEV